MVYAPASNALRPDMNHRGPYDSRGQHALLGIPAPGDTPLHRPLDVILGIPARTKERDLAVAHVMVSSIPPWEALVGPLGRLLGRVSHGEDVHAFPDGSHFLQAGQGIVARLPTPHTMMEPDHHRKACPRAGEHHVEEPCGS